MEAFQQCAGSEKCQCFPEEGIISCRYTAELPIATIQASVGSYQLADLEDNFFYYSALFDFLTTFSNVTWIDVRGNNFDVTCDTMLHDFTKLGLLRAATDQCGVMILNKTEPSTPSSLTPTHAAITESTAAELSSPVVSPDIPSTTPSNTPIVTNHASTTLTPTQDIKTTSTSVHDISTYSRITTVAPERDVTTYSKTGTEPETDDVSTSSTIRMTSDSTEIDSGGVTAAADTQPEPEDILMEILQWGLGVVGAAVMIVAAALIYRFRAGLYRYRACIRCSECALLVCVLSVQCSASLSICYSFLFYVILFLHVDSLLL